jgi:hypothetical protein
MIALTASFLECKHARAAVLTAPHDFSSHHLFFWILNIITKLSAVVA